jgi:hypothetical protein
VITDPLEFVKKFIIGLFLLVGGFLAYFVLKLIYGAVMGAVDTSGWDSTVVTLALLLPAIIFVGTAVKVYLYVADRSGARQDSYRPRPRKGSGFKLPWQ